MNINCRTVFKLQHQPLCSFERLIERVGVGPGKKHGVRLGVVVNEGMRPGHLEGGVLFIHAPSNWPGATPPLHIIWETSEHRPQPHFVKLTLETHVLHAESISIAILNAINAKIEP